MDKNILSIKQIIGTADAVDVSDGVKIYNKIDEIISEKGIVFLDFKDINLADEDFKYIDSERFEEIISKIDDLYREYWYDDNIKQEEESNLDVMVEDIFYKFIGNAKVKIEIKTREMTKNYISTQLTKLIEFDKSLYAVLPTDAQKFLGTIIDIPEEFKRSLNTGLWNLKK